MSSVTSLFSSPVPISVIEPFPILGGLFVIVCVRLRIRQQMGENKRKTKEKHRNSACYESRTGFVKQVEAGV